jgi:energy-converting hydrogenase Eha subunit A
MRVLWPIAAVAGGIATAAVLAMADVPRDEVVRASFRFDQVSFSSPVLGGALTPADLARVESVARAELAAAFQGLRIAITDRRDTRYHVRVVQELDDSPLTRPTWVAGSSHAVPGFGGSGAVNFTYFASGALVFAPPQASRSELIDAIGRGIGRGAAHEFAHQLLGAAIHATNDRGSYEYHAASRPQQYYGPMHWDVAGSLLAKKFGTSDH